MYKPLTTTKAEMIAAIEKLAQITRRHVNMSKVNEHVGKLQSIASHLPETDESQGVKTMGEILRESINEGIKEEK